MSSKEINNQKIYCKGRTLKTGQPCGELICETDGKKFYIGGFALRIDPPRIVCDKCGYETRLNYSKKKKRMDLNYQY